MKNKVALMQPTFLPWQGFFELILKSDRFVFLDDFQYITRSHHTRNRLFVSSNVVDFYSVSIDRTQSYRAPLNKTIINNNVEWTEKIIKRLLHVYRKTAFFNEFFPHIKSWLSRNFGSLAELNIAGIKLICSFLNIEKKFLYSSDFTKETNSQSVRSQKMLDLLKWAKATEYLCAFGSFDYMKEDGIFPSEDVDVKFQNFVPKSYPQAHSPDKFIPYLSILDALFNVGPEETLNLIEEGSIHWLSWEERAKLL